MDETVRSGLHLVHGPDQSGKTTLLRQVIQRAQDDKHSNWVATPTPEEFAGAHPQCLECNDNEHPVSGIVRHLGEVLEQRVDAATAMRPLVLAIDDGDPKELFAGDCLPVLWRVAKVGQALRVGVWIALPMVPEVMPRALLAQVASVTDCSAAAQGINA